MASHKRTLGLCLSSIRHSPFTHPGSLVLVLILAHATPPVSQFFFWLSPDGTSRYVRILQSGDVGDGSWVQGSEGRVLILIFFSLWVGGMLGYS